jgi:hypothetical protein
MGKGWVPASAGTNGWSFLHSRKCGLFELIRDARDGGHGADLVRLGAGAADPDRADRFFADLIGTPPASGMTFAMLRCPAIRLPGSVAFAHSAEDRRAVSAV